MQQSKLFYHIEGRGLPLYRCIALAVEVERQGLKILNTTIREGKGRQNGSRQ